MSCRLPDWESRLHAFLEGAFDRPHAYASHDCLVGLTAGVLEALTGEDHAAEHRGKYRSQAGAVRHLKRLGYASPEALLDDRLEAKPIAFAQRGDLVLVPGNLIEDMPPSWSIPAVCYGDYALVIAEAAVLGGTPRQGLGRVPRRYWLKAYAVGDHHSDCGASA